MTLAATEPAYEAFCKMADTRRPLAELFALQVRETVRPFVATPPGEWDVLDVGCGYGDTAAALAATCRRVVGVEPTSALFQQARLLPERYGRANLTIRRGGIEDVGADERFDVVVLDNVFEHLPDQPAALRTIGAVLRPGGACFLLMPNKLWPVEVHYKLPFLSYLPLPLANRYLRCSGRGTDYTDASYAPTYGRLRELFRRQRDLDPHFVLPAVPHATMAGTPWTYRVGMAALQRCPMLWAISKAFLVVATKRGGTP